MTYQEQQQSFSQNAFLNFTDVNVDFSWNGKNNGYCDNSIKIILR